MLELFLAHARKKPHPTDFICNLFCSFFVFSLWKIILFWNVGSYYFCHRRYKFTGLCLPWNLSEGCPIGKCFINIYTQFLPASMFECNSIFRVDCICTINYTELILFFWLYKLFFCWWLWNWVFLSMSYWLCNVLYLVFNVFYKLESKIIWSIKTLVNFGFLRSDELNMYFLFEAC